MGCRESILRMGSGTVASALRRTNVLSAICVGVVVISSVLVGATDLSVPWLVTAQIASAIAGAALGNLVRVDLSASVVRNQARPAVRHLFDQVSRLRGLVVQAEAHQVHVSQARPDGAGLDPERVADWFGSLGGNLRDEINATALAIEHWGDMARDVRDDELDLFKNRDARLPPHQNEAGTNHD